MDFFSICGHWLNPASRKQSNNTDESTFGKREGYCTWDGEELREEGKCPHYACQAAKVIDMCASERRKEGNPYVVRVPSVHPYNADSPPQFHN